MTSLGSLVYQPTRCACSEALRLSAPDDSAALASAWACRSFTWASCCARAAFKEALAACTHEMQRLSVYGCMPQKIGTPLLLILHH